MEMKLLKNKKSNRISEQINKALEIPREISSDDIKISIIGFDEMLIENYKGILEYEEFYIKIKTSQGNININGYNLSLEQITQDDICVKGKIENIDIERIQEEEE